MRKDGRFNPYRSQGGNKKWGKFWRTTSHYAHINRRGIANRQLPLPWLVTIKDTTTGAEFRACQITHPFVVNPYHGRGTGHANDWIMKDPECGLTVIDHEDFLEQFEVVDG